MTRAGADVARYIALRRQRERGIALAYIGVSQISPSRSGFAPKNPAASKSLPLHGQALVATP